MPKLLTTTQSWRSVRPGPPKASPTRPEYEAVLEARVNRMIMSMDDSVNIAPKTIIIRPGIRPNCLTAAGRAMIPAPTIVVDMLKTAPENDAPLKPTSAESWSSCFWGRSGILGLRRYFLSDETIVILVDYGGCWVGR